MEIDPFSCEVDSILSFLQFLLETGVTESTLRGYVAAISDRHEGYGGNTVGFQPLVRRYLKGARRLQTSDFSPPDLIWSISSSANSLMGPGYCIEGSDRTTF